MAGIIDIGSNSVRLLLDGHKEVVTTRLSEGLAASGELSEEAMDRTFETLLDFVRKTEEAGQTVYAFATEPLRAAANAEEFLSRVREATGVEIDVLTDDEEGELAFLGAAGGGGGAVIDIGGASVEIICGNAEGALYEKSLPVGAVRLTESCGADTEKLQEMISGIIPGYGNPPVKHFAYGVGGTFTSLAAALIGLTEYSPEAVHGTLLTKADLESLAENLVSMCGDTDRICEAYPSIDIKRAEIITAGALFALELVRYFELEYIQVSETDNLEGYGILHSLL